MTAMPCESVTSLHCLAAGEVERTREITLFLAAVVLKRTCVLDSICGRVRACKLRCL